MSGLRRGKREITDKQMSSEVKLNLKRKMKETKIQQMGQQQIGDKAKTKNAARRNNDLILESMPNIIGQKGP